MKTYFGFGVLMLLTVLALGQTSQTSRPVTDQVTCTGTALPGSLFAFVAQAPGIAGATPVALQPFRCLALDPNVFAINSLGQLSIKTPAPIAGTLCNPPPAGSANGAIVYAQTPDKSCLPLVAIADPAVLQGFTGDTQYLLVHIPGATVSPTPVQPPQ